MSSGSYNSVNKDDDEEEYGQAGQGGGNYRQFPSTQYYDSQAATLQPREQQDGMTPQPSVGRFTEKEKTTTMFSRKPPTPKNYDGAPPSYSHHGMQHHSQQSDRSSSQLSHSDGIVNLRAAAPRAEDKMSKRNK